MIPTLRFLRFGLLAAAIYGTGPSVVAKDAFATNDSRAEADAALSPPFGPREVYANIPVKDEFGRDQMAMFRAWNPDPVGDHEAKLEALDPSLARVVRKVQADNPELRFVIGSGKRDDSLQRKALAWGWSRSRYSRHQSGGAVDLWPLDTNGRVTFDQATQSRIGAAMKKAAAALQVAIRWGGNFRSFKDRDRSHFELASQ